MKEDSFECHDVHIRTRELEYRDQTLSVRNCLSVSTATHSSLSQFEELVNQFIPSDLSWRGWVKMVFHQPLVPVLPVARELLSKTKWLNSKGSHSDVQADRSDAQIHAEIQNSHISWPDLSLLDALHMQTGERSSRTQEHPSLIASSSRKEHEPTATRNWDSAPETVRPGRKLTMLRMLGLRNPSRARKTVDVRTLHNVRCLTLSELLLT